MLISQYSHFFCEVLATFLSPSEDCGCFVFLKSVTSEVIQRMESLCVIRFSLIESFWYKLWTFKSLIR